MPISGDPFYPETFLRTPIVLVVFLRMVTMNKFIYFALSRNFFLLRSRTFGFSYPIMSFPWPVFVVFVVLTFSRSAVHCMTSGALLLQMGASAQYGEVLCAVEPLSYMIFGILSFLL